MFATVKTQLGAHRKCLLVGVFLLFTILMVSLMIYASNMGFESSSDVRSSLEGAVHVNSESGLRVALENAPANTSVIIVLDNDIALTNGPIVIGDNQDVTLTSNRVFKFYKLIGATKQTITDSGMTVRFNTISVGSGGVLRVDGIIVTHAKDIPGTGIYVGSDGTFIMYDGEISGNNNPVSYMGHGHVEIGSGGVRNYGTFEMYGGKITDNTAANGGGVGSAGDFIMYGGSISNNHAQYLSSPFGQSSGYGGGVNGKLVMHDGTISGNHADYDGGGVFCGDFIMYGGSISNNHAKRTGGGVYVHESDSFTMFDGIITGNHADESDGGVCGTVDRLGGKIYGNMENNTIYVIICCVGFFVIIGVVVFLFLHFKSHRKRKMLAVVC